MWNDGGAMLCFVLMCCAGDAEVLDRSGRLTVLLHDRKELDDDLGGRTNKHLALALALGVDNAVKSVVLPVRIQRCKFQKQHCQPTLGPLLCMFHHDQQWSVGERVVEEEDRRKLTRTEMRTMVGDVCDLLGRYRQSVGNKRWRDDDGEEVGG